MSWTRGKDKANPGKFEFTCYDWKNNIFQSQGGFADALEADQAAEQAERAMTMQMLTPPKSREELDAEMDEIDAMLRELRA